jgi:hypothetical protein
MQEPTAQDARDPILVDLDRQQPALNPPTHRWPAQPETGGGFGLGHVAVRSQHRRLRVQKFWLSYITDMSVSQLYFSRRVAAPRRVAQASALNKG